MQIFVHRHTNYIPPATPPEKKSSIYKYKLFSAFFFRWFFFFEVLKASRLLNRHATIWATPPTSNLFFNFYSILLLYWGYMVTFIKLLQYIIVEFTPSIILLYPPSNSWFFKIIRVIYSNLNCNKIIFNNLKVCSAF
jgi:hypothetical protein